MNYEFDLDEWLPRFPLQERHGHYSASHITSPCDLCTIEWLRRELIDQYVWGRAIPVDIFVMSKGEPENRFATKIGGIPYRPRDLPWPQGPNGRPLAMIAQINFTNSTDIVGKLPGDLLLVFGDDSEGIVEPFHIEWQSLGMENLIRPTDIPSDCIKIAPCFGNRCRMMSFPDAVQKSDSNYPICRGKDVWSPYWIPQFQATQIGRAPFGIQEGDYSETEHHLCTISSVQPDKRRPYPWVNVPEPLCREGEWPDPGDELMIGDLGCIYILINDDGKLYSSVSCH